MSEEAMLHLTGRCVRCGSARLIPYDGTGYPLVRCESCDLVANATDTTTLLPVKLRTVTAGVGDLAGALEDIESQLDAAASELDDAISDIRLALRNLERRIEKAAS